MQRPYPPLPVFSASQKPRLHMLKLCSLWKERAPNHKNLHKCLSKSSITIATPKKRNGPKPFKENIHAWRPATLLQQATCHSPIHLPEDIIMEPQNTIWLTLNQSHEPWTQDYSAWPHNKQDRTPTRIWTMGMKHNQCQFLYNTRLRVMFKQCSVINKRD
jgi:hypothetical protein